VRFNGNVDEIPVRISRKQATPWTDWRDWRVTGIEVERDGVGDYYGFTLDGNGRFLLADGTVTHNTAFSLACGLNAATHPEKPQSVAIFSLEMGAQQLAQRLLTSEARVDAQRARTGRMKDDDWQKLARAAGKLSDASLFIDDTPGLSVLELRAKCRRLKAEHGLDLVVVDYLQLMQASASKRTQNREQEIAHISRSLKGLAKELDVPVLALSQLNRGVENRGGDKRPQLSDLRESGSIEQDADVVAFIYRAERYGITVDDQGNSTEGLAEIIIGKQRNGPIGTVELAFVDRYARFENLTTRYDDNSGGSGQGGGFNDGGGDSLPPFNGDGGGAIPEPPPDDEEAPF
jgi:replicative DNA helicase